MSQFILINHIKVQNANAIAGFTWGFPAITHFLGFLHNLSRKLKDDELYSDIDFDGCAVIAHGHNVHTYGPSYERRFTQSRNPPQDKGKDNKGRDKLTITPSVIEEGKMNMTVSLLIGCEGNVGNRADNLQEWLKRNCFLQRLAGGTILDIANISFHAPKDKRDVRNITRRLLPGFILQDRSQYLAAHYQNLLANNPDSELLNAWLDYSAMKHKARPKSNLITTHLQTLINKNPADQLAGELAAMWYKQLEKPYEVGKIPKELQAYFTQLEATSSNKKLLQQWQDYCRPSEQTSADWEYIKKPQPGYLVPIMTGFKAISPVYTNSEVRNTRDNETDVCFVESVHSIGEWQSAHHLKTLQDLLSCLWHYHYEENWYLCKQYKDQQISEVMSSPHGQDGKQEDEIYS